MPDGILGPDEMAIRFADICKIAERFAIRFNKLNNDTVNFDTSAMYLVTSSACQDINRYKQYHTKDPTKDKLNAVKRAVYFTKWIIRIKPMTTIPSQEIDTSSMRLLINELLAVHYAETVLSACLHQPVSLSASIKTDLYYTLLYRGLDDAGLLLFYQTVYNQVAGIGLLTE